MIARLIDGKAAAARLNAALAERLAALKSRTGLVPGLAAVLVGEDPASQVYVRNKGLAAAAAGLLSRQLQLSADTSEDELLGTVRRLNADPAIHGILVQLPLPPQIDAAKVIDAIDPAKDVDGFHVVNAGRLAVGLPAMVPCTPSGCLYLLRAELPSLVGARALVLGRSNIVGKPMAQLLLAEHCTVTMAHSRTRDLPEECRRADILIAAVGRPEMVRGTWIKPGAIVIDVGINRVRLPDGKTRLVGDVAFAEAREVAAAITPVPGGIGPMTVAFLLQNTVTGACRQAGIAA